MPGPLSAGLATALFSPLHGVGLSPAYSSSSPPASAPASTFFSSSSRSTAFVHTSASVAAASDASSPTASPPLPLPRLLSPTLPSDSRSFSFRKWLSRKFGYDKFRPVVRLYAATSEQARSPLFARSNVTAVPVCASTACALLTLHMWIVHSRMRIMAASAWKSGREAESKQLHANTRLLFNLAWQEMEHALKDSDEQQLQDGQDSALPSHYTLNDYCQLSYGAMVSYDRAWAHYRSTGQRTDMHGALWRNIWTTATPLTTSQLHTLTAYVEHAIQLSNHWTAHDLTVSGTVRWPTLPVDESGGGGEVVRYESAVYDGSRVGEGESVGVPVGLWRVGDDDLLLVQTDKVEKRLEGQARKRQQLSSADDRKLENIASKK